MMMNTARINKVPSNFKFKLNKHVHGIQHYLQLATNSISPLVKSPPCPSIDVAFSQALKAFNVDSAVTYTAMSGIPQAIIWGEESHEDDDDFVMLQHGPAPMNPEDFFKLKVRAAIQRAMRKVGDIYTENVAVEEFDMDPAYYRMYVRQRSKMYIPESGKDRKRGVQEIDYRYMDSVSFKNTFGEIGRLTQANSVVFLHHNNIRFYYRKNEYKVGIIINLKVIHDVESLKDQLRVYWERLNANKV
jgi:hypothetical protein